MCKACWAHCIGSSSFASLPATPPEGPPTLPNSASAQLLELPSAHAVPVPKPMGLGDHGAKTQAGEADSAMVCPALANLAEHAEHAPWQYPCTELHCQNTGPQHRRLSPQTSLSYPL